MCGFVGCFDLNSGSMPINEGLKEELRNHQRTCVEFQFLSFSKLNHEAPTLFSSIASHPSSTSHKHTQQNPAQHDFIISIQCIAAISQRDFSSSASKEPTSVPVES